MHQKDTRFGNEAQNRSMKLKTSCLNEHLKFQRQIMVAIHFSWRTQHRKIRRSARKQTRKPLNLCGFAHAYTQCDRCSAFALVLQSFCFWHLMLDLKWTENGTNPIHSPTQECGARIGSASWRACCRRCEVPGLWPGLGCGWQGLLVTTGYEGCWR